MPDDAKPVVLNEAGEIVQSYISPAPPVYQGALEFNPSLGTAQLLPSRCMFDKFTGYHGGFFVGRTIENNVWYGNGPDAPLTSAPVFHRGEGHLLICAETRSGKSERILVPNLGLWPGSALVVDCKGALATMTAERRGPGSKYCDGMGQKVRVLDPERISDVPEELRGSFNPLDWLSADDDGCISKARTITGALIPDEPGKGDDYWPKASRELLTVLITHVATDTRLIAERRNLSTVFDFIMEGDQILKEAYRESGILDDEDGNEVETSGHEILIQSMQDNPVFLNYVSRYANSLTELFKKAEKQWVGLQTSTSESLNWLADPRMQKCMNTSDIDFAELKNNPDGMTVYLAVKDMRKCHLWVRMIVAIFNEQMQTFDAPATGHQILVVLDEFASLKAMTEMPDLIDKCADYSIRMCVIIQRITQLQDIYPRNWHGFLAAADVRWFFGIEEHPTREFLVKELGEIEVIRTTRSFTLADGSTVQRTVSMGKSTMKTKTVGDSYTKNATWNASENSGTSDADGTSTSQGISHRETILGFIAGRFFDNPLIMPGDKNSSSGASKTRTTSGGQSQGFGGGETAGESSSLADALGHNFGEAIAEGTSTTASYGINESIHKRPLISFSEIPEAFAKVTNPEDPRFPGQALVVFRGGLRGIVRTSEYYKDPLFYRTYGPHPKYPFVQTPYPWTELKAIEERERRIEAELERRFDPTKDKIEAEEAAREAEEAAYEAAREAEHERRAYEQTIKAAVEYVATCREKIINDFSVTLRCNYTPTAKTLPFFYSLKCKRKEGPMAKGQTVCELVIDRTFDGQTHVYRHPIIKAPCKGKILRSKISTEQNVVEVEFQPYELGTNKPLLDNVLQSAENITQATALGSSPHEAAEEFVKSYQGIARGTAQKFQSGYQCPTPVLSDYFVEGDPGLMGKMAEEINEAGKFLGNVGIYIFVMASMVVGFVTLMMVLSNLP